MKHCIAYLSYFLFVTCRASEQQRKENLICKEDSTRHDDIPCEAVIDSSPTCLICPIQRDENVGLSWTHSYDAHNETIFIDTVRLQGNVDTYAINVCGVKNYTLSVFPADLGDGGRYICSLERTVVASFNLTIKAAPKLFLRCKEPKEDCESRLRSNVTLMFACQVLNARGQVVISWSLDDATVYSSSYAEGKESLIHTFVHTFKGNEERVMCQVDGPNIQTVKKVFKFTSVKNKVFPVLSIYWNGTRNETPIPFQKFETICLECVAINVGLPIALSLEVDGHKIYSRIFRSTEDFPTDDLIYSNITTIVDNYNSTFTQKERFSIFVNHTPSECSPLVICVCDGRYILRSKLLVPFVLIRTINQTSVYVGKQSFQRSLMLALYLALVVFIIMTVLVTSKKRRCICIVPNVGIVYTPTNAAHNPSSSTRRSIILNNQIITNGTIRSQQANVTNFHNDVSAELSSFVQLVTKISHQGRHQRWIGELSGSIYNRRICVACTFKNGATESDISQLKLLAMCLKGNPYHKNVVHVIGTETKHEPYFIYTEYVEMGNLKDFLIDQQHQPLHQEAKFEELFRFSQEVSSAMMYLKSNRLCQPGICCEKVLLTKQRNCKVYDIQLYPVSKESIEYLVLKHEKSSTQWTLAPETRLKMEHTSDSDSWSLAVFIHEIYTLGEDADKTSVKKFYQVPSNWSSGHFTRPHLCPESLYSHMKLAWRKQSSRRPRIEDICNFLSDLKDKEACSPYQIVNIDSETYYHSPTANT